jgi:dienelactone hydrolase
MIVVALLACAPLLASCMKFHLIHPREVPRQVTAWSQDAVSGDLMIHMEWASPVGPGPWPAVLVHPDAGHQARHLKGVIWDLASRGYLAAAADYERRLHGRFRRTLFAWRDPSDAGRALEILRANPKVDRARIALMGFSQGGVFSLLIAAHEADVRAVVAYYPVTDFTEWLGRYQTNPIRRCIFRMIEGHFRRQSGARDEAEFRRILSYASPYQQAEKILAPVLLIHGDADTSAPVEESQRMAARLTELGREVELMIIPGAGHVFNFYDAPSARRAWDATLAFLARNLERDPAPNPWKQKGRSFERPRIEAVSVDRTRACSHPRRTAGCSRPRRCRSVCRPAGSVRPSWPRRGES